MPYRRLRSAREVVDALGGYPKVAKLTGRTAHATYNWTMAGTFPANAYVAMINALNAAGFSAPPSLWDMRGKTGERGVKPRPVGGKRRKRGEADSHPEAAE